MCTIGPLYVGEVLSDTYGLIWTHGVYVAGNFVPGSMTYFHSTIEVNIYIGFVYANWHAFSVTY